MFGGHGYLIFAVVAALLVARVIYGLARARRKKGQ
jgi:hypothetical protein